MSHEINQLDIPDRQMKAGGARPGNWTEIGEAKVTHSIFGRARVRIIRKQDKTRRILVWLAGIVVVVAAAAVWQGRLTSQQAEGASDAIAPAPQAEEKDTAPPFQPASALPSSIAPALTKQPDAQAQEGIEHPDVITTNLPQAAQDVRGNAAQAVKPPVSSLKSRTVQRKPVAAQSQAADSPHSERAAVTDPAANPADMQAQPGASPTKMPTAVVTPPPTMIDQPSVPANAQSR